MGKHGAPQRFPEENPDKNSAASYRMIILQVCNVLSEACFLQWKSLKVVSRFKTRMTPEFIEKFVLNAPSKVMIADFLFFFQLDLYGTPYWRRFEWTQCFPAKSHVSCLRISLGPFVQCPRYTCTYSTYIWYTCIYIYIYTHPYVYWYSCIFICLYTIIFWYIWFNIFIYKHI